MSKDKTKRKSSQYKMARTDKTVKGPQDTSPRVRGNKAGKDRVLLPYGHPSRTHEPRKIVRCFYCQKKGQRNHQLENGLVVQVCQSHPMRKFPPRQFGGVRSKGNWATQLKGLK